MRASNHHTNTHTHTLGFFPQHRPLPLRTQVDEEKPDCALVQPTKGHTMLQLDGTCGTEVVAEELIEGFTFEPRCLVLVLALENERAVFDSMLAAGRKLTNPFVSKHATQTADLSAQHQPYPFYLAGNSS